MIRNAEMTISQMNDNQLIYTFNPYEHEPWKQAVAEMYDDGVRIFSFLCPLPLAWQEDGSFDFTLLDELMDQILELAPEARFLPRTFLETPDWWDRLHEEELLKFDGPAPRENDFGHGLQRLWKYENKIYHCVRNPSVASEIWRRDAARALRAFAGHLLERYGIGHAYGIHLAYGTCGEWGQFGSYLNGQFANGDFSRPMVAAYRRYLKEHYGDREEFRTILPPAKTERMATEWGILRSPAFFRRLRDYYACAAEEQFKSVQIFARAVKSVSPQLKTGIFGLGMMIPGCSAYQLHHLDKAAEGLAPAEMPELDFISAPNGYFNRQQGMYSQTPERSVSLRKTLIAECDVRTACSGDAYSPSEAQSLNQFLLETGYNLTTGSGRFWLYDFGRHWYGSPEIRAVIRRYGELLSGSSQTLPQADIAVVIDSASVFCSEGSSGYYRGFLRFLTKELPRSGFSFDAVCLQDMFQSRPYKLYIFRDKFLTDPEESDRIRRFLEENHASAIWFGPAGAVSPEGIDFAGSERLTGFSLKPVRDVIGSNSVTYYSHPLLEGLPLPYSMTQVEDFNTVYAPVLTGEGGEVLGLVESTGLPGCLLRQEEKRFELWSNFPAVPSELLRALCLRYGMPPRISGPALSYGAGKRLVVRADRAGRVEVRTSGTAVRNLISGEDYPAVEGSVSLNMTEGQTVLLEEY